MRLPLGLAGAFIAGGLGVLAFAPLALFPLAWMSLAALWLLLARSRGWRQGALVGFAWGLGYFLGGVSWLYVALHRYGGLAAPLAGLAILLFCAVLALYPALAGGLFVRLRRGRPLADAALAGALWLTVEWLRGWLFTGFPWLSIGYSQTPPSPLAGWLPVVGVLGVGALVAASAALLAGGCATLRPAAGVLVILCVAGAGLSHVGWVEPVGEPLDVALVQTNVEQQLKWDPTLTARWLEHNLDLVREHPARLVVLPETALPMLADRLPASYFEALAEPLRAQGGSLIVGVFMRDAAGHIYNGALSLGAAAGQHYAKQHLVPFGEYSPPLFGWFYGLVDIPMSDQTRGPAGQAPMRIADQRVALNICYEDVFGEELIRALPQATLMLNLSNLAWYGDSFAQPQHLQIARVRALEAGRPMLRATNTGMTAVVMPDGAVSQLLPAFTTGVLHASVRGYQGLTPYARWGNWPVVGLALLLLAGALWAARRERQLEA
jgi:apolipoprotein N-acyltransferase